MLRVDDVRRIPAYAILDAAIDTPAVGWEFGGHSIHLNGWVVGAGPCRGVEVVHHDVVLRTVPLGPRPDIADIPAYRHLAWAGGSGFSTGVGLLGLPERFALRVRAILNDGTRAEIAVLEGSRTPVRFEGPAQGPRPLMVTCLGRSGTTLLMELLGAHPSVVVHDVHPYETRCATYWMHLLKVGGEAGPVVSPQAWHDELSQLATVSPIPFFGQVPGEPLAWMTSAYTERLAAFCWSATTGFYANCAAVQGKQGAVAFSEKLFPGILADVLAEVCPGQPELVSVRDPRDMLLSILSFLRSGHTVLHHSAADATSAVVARFTSELRLLAARIARLGERAIVVRYEDLVEDAEVTLLRALDVVELPSSRADVAAMRAASATRREQYERHRTSMSTEASLGRWRREFRRELASTWTAELEELTVALGYAPTT